MTLLPPLQREDLAAEHQAIWDEIASFGPVAPKLQVIAHHPEVLREYWRLGVVLNEQAGLDAATMNLLVMRTSLLDQNAYGWRQRVPKALAAGLSQDKIDALDDWEDSALFSPSERAVLAYTDAVLGAGEVDRSVVDQMKRHFPPATVLAVTMLALFYNFSHRLVDVLDVEPASGNEGAPLPWQGQ